MYLFKKGALFLVPLVLISCRGSESPSPNISIHELGIEVSRAELSENQRQIMIRVDKKQTVGLKQVTKSVLESHKVSFLSYNTDDSVNISGDLMSYLSPLNTSVDRDMDLHEFKLNYEDNFSEMHDENDLIYNKDHVSVFSSIFENRMQCYSGTILFDVLLRDFKGSKYYGMNQVFIFESGHVLPGYFVKESGEWNLYGVETTASGRAKKIYGPAKDLSQVRVVDAHVAMVLDALDVVITNPQAVMVNALVKTAELYDIPVGKIESELLNPMIPFSGDMNPSQVAKNTSEYLNSSLFSFGSSSLVPSGDRTPRPEFDEKDVSKGALGAAGLFGGGVFISEQEMESEVGGLFNTNDIIVLKPSNDVLEVIDHGYGDLSPLSIAEGEMTLFRGEYTFTDEVSFAAFGDVTSLVAKRAMDKEMVPHHFRISIEGFNEPTSGGGPNAMICLDSISTNKESLERFHSSCTNAISLYTVSISEDIDKVEFSVENLFQIFGETMSVDIIRCSNEEVNATNVICPGYEVEAIEEDTDEPLDNLVSLPVVSDEESEFLDDDVSLGVEVFDAIPAVHEDGSIIQVP